MDKLWKTNPSEPLQSQSRSWLTNNTALNLTAQRIICKRKYQRGHSLRKLEINLKGKQLSVSRESIRRLKTFGALWLQLFMPSQSRKHQRHSNVVFGNLWNQFLWPLCKISSVQCLTDWRQSSETQETLFRTNICVLSWSNIVCRSVIVQFFGVMTLLHIIIIAEELSV